MTSSGFTSTGAHAVAFAETSKKSMPMIRPNQVGTFDWDVTTIPLTPPSRLLHPGTPARHTTLATVVALLTVLTAFLLAGVALYCTATLSEHWLVREMLHACERRGVGARLKLALDEHRVADVDDQADADDQHDHRQCDDGAGPARSRRLPGGATPTCPRVPVFAIRGIHRRTITAPIGGFPSLEPVTGHELAVWRTDPPEGLGAA